MNQRQSEVLSQYNKLSNEINQIYKSNQQQYWRGNQIYRSRGTQEFQRVAGFCDGMNRIAASSQRMVLATIYLCVALVRLHIVTPTFLALPTGPVRPSLHFCNSCRKSCAIE